LSILFIASNDSYDSFLKIQVESYVAYTSDKKVLPTLIFKDKVQKGTNQMKKNKKNVVSKAEVYRDTSTSYRTNPNIKKTNRDGSVWYLLNDVVTQYIPNAAQVTVNGIVKTKIPSDMKRYWHIEGQRGKPSVWLNDEGVAYLFTHCKDTREDVAKAVGAVSELQTAVELNNERKFDRKSVELEAYMNLSEHLLKFGVDTRSAIMTARDVYGNSFTAVTDNEINTIVDSVCVVNVTDSVSRRATVSDIARALKKLGYDYSGRKVNKVLAENGYAELKPNKYVEGNFIHVATEKGKPFATRYGASYHWDQNMVIGLVQRVENKSKMYLTDKANA